MMKQAYPRVSDILEVLYPKGYLLEEWLEEGASNHAELEGVLKALLPHESGEAHYISPTLSLRVMKALEWCKDNRVYPTALESKQVNEKLGFCGHPDFLGLKGRAHWGIDWKFAENLTEANYVQIEAYRLLCPGFQWALVQIPKEGKVRFERCPRRADYQAAFLSGLAVWKWRNR